MTSFPHCPESISASLIVRFVFPRGHNGTFEKEIFPPMASNKYEIPTLYGSIAALR
jgi:hypothetical protein